MEFTFHYVSIKSTDAEDNHIHGNIFTFHYVSIKSKLVLTVNDSDTYLHSTMYLLNLKKVEIRPTKKEFTFHYVSIKS